MRIKGLRSVIILAVLASVVAAAGIVLRGFVLHQVRSALSGSFHSGAIRLSAAPPSLVIEDIRTISASPFFSARKVTVRFSLLSLFTRYRPIGVRIESPVLRISDSDAEEPRKPLNLGTLPFSVERGTLVDGEVYYFGRAGTFLAKGIRAAFRRSGDSSTLRLESDDNAWLMPSIRTPLSATLSAFVESRGAEIFFRRVTIAGSDVFVRAQGSLSGREDPRVELQASVHAPVALVADILDLPFRWAGRVEGEGDIAWRGGKASVKAALSSRDLGLNGWSLGRVDGDLAVETDSGGRVRLLRRPPSEPSESVTIEFGRGKVEGTVEGAHLDPVIEEIDIPWPVKSPAWGRFAFENDRLDVEAEFRDELMVASGDRYPVRGAAEAHWDGKSLVRVSSPSLETSFGTFGVDGEIDVGRRIRLDIRGEASDIRQGRAFAELVLGEEFGVPEIRGRGRTDMTIGGDWGAPAFRADFDAAPAGFDRFDAARVDGRFEFERGTALGLFRVRDPGMAGEITLKAEGDTFEAKIRADDAAVERVLASLGIRFPLAARGSGMFTVSGGPDALHVEGDFAAPSARLAGQPLTDVRGSLDWDGPSDRLSFPSLEARLYGGTVKGSGSVGFGARSFSLDAAAAGIDLGTLDPKLKGRLSFGLKGAGSLDRDPAAGAFSLEGAAYGPASGLAASGTIEVRYPGSELSVLVSGAVLPGENDFSASFTYPQPDGSFTAEVKGRLTNPDLVMPWPGVRGEMNYLVDIKGGTGPAQANGVVDFKGPLFPIPRLAQSIDDFSGLVFIQNDRATIRSLQAKFGGGDVTGTGEVRFGGGGIASIDVRAEGKDMSLALLERARGQADASFRLIKNESRFLLSGDVQFHSLLWRREITEKLAFMSEPASGSPREPGPFDDLELDIRLRADEGAVIENSLGRIQGRFDLSLSGSVSAPVLLGDIEGLRGDVLFQDRDFRVLKARLSFINPAAIEPYLDFQGETFLKDYRVTFSLTGLADRLKPEFSSSPPLPSEDVLALLALGESFKRTYSYDTSSQLGTGSLISFQLAEEAKKRAERLFNLDRFRIDPFVLGASTEMTARLTVGKKISRNIILLYSTNLTSQREEIIRLEWEFSDSFSLIGMRDERGRISFDAKLRKRF